MGRSSDEDEGVSQGGMGCFAKLSMDQSSDTQVEDEQAGNLKRQWNGLPSTALLNIFCKSELKDRLKSIPLVCKSWKYVTDDPRCWSSMIPDSVSPEDAFIKKIRYPLESYRLISKYYDPYRQSIDYNYLNGVSRLFKEEDEEEEEEEEEEEVLPVGLKRLLTLIKKSGGGAAITTLYLSPFTPYHGPWSYYGIDEEYDDETYDEILHLIANCCPNLKHISFKVYPDTCIEVVHLLFNKCKKLELIELVYDRQDRFEDEEQPYLELLELLSCLPDLYGFRFDNSHHDRFIPIPTIVTHLPRLKLLRLEGVSLYDDHISIILLSCLELQYLCVALDYEQIYYNPDIIDQASVSIPEFIIKGGYGYL